MGGAGDELCPDRCDDDRAAQRAARAGRRNRVIADNVANVETPGFLAGRVDFESSLRAAVADGTNPDVAPSTARSLEPTRTNGNNVNLDEETLAGLTTNLRYSAAIEAMNGKFSLLRTAIRGDG